jgi:hypothetical protein
MSYYQTIKDTQRAARKVARETGKPAVERTKKNVAGKTRTVDNPYAQWTDPVNPQWSFCILKSYQADNSKEYGRWFMAVKSPNTYGAWELGDGYVREYRQSILRALNAGVMNVDESIWPVDDEVNSYSGSFAAWVWGEQ